MVGLGATPYEYMDPYRERDFGHEEAQSLWMKGLGGRLLDLEFRVKALEFRV